jgi:hypothetical protein
MDTPPDSAPWPTTRPSRRASRDTLQRAIERHRGRPLGELLVERGLGSYRGYAEILESIERRVEDGARLTQIGRSVCDEPLFAVCFGPAAPTETTRTSVVLSGLHPLEWIGVETHLALMHRMARHDLGGRSVVSIPVANPDGLLRVERNLRQGRRRLVRHNERGVDLNRNFDAAWAERGALGVGLPWRSRAGSYPASEPEIAAIAFTLGNRRIDRAVSLHSSGGAVLYPSAQSLLPIADAAEHRQWARYIAVHGCGPDAAAGPCSWRRGGLAHGGLELDWFHQRHGALSLLVSCPGGTIGLRPARAFEPFAWFNPEQPRPVAQQLADALAPFVRGDPSPPAEAAG